MGTRTVDASPGRAPLSWTDLLIDRLSGLRWPLGAILGVLTIVGVLGVHLVSWAAGILPVGEFDAFRASIAVYPFGILAILAYLDRV